MDKKSLESLVGNELQAAGFKKKGSSWYFQSAGGLLVLDLQKSKYGAQFYVNLCCVPAGMNVQGMPTPKEHKCPIRIRLASAFPKKEREIEETFDLEDASLQDSARAGRITSLVYNLVLPFFENMKSLASLKDAIKKGVFDSGMVDLEVKRHLGVTPL